MAGGSYVWLSNNEKKKNVRVARSGARKRNVVRVSTWSCDLVGFVPAGDGRVGLGMVCGVGYGAGGGECGVVCECARGVRGVYEVHGVG